MKSDDSDDYEASYEDECSFNLNDSDSIEKNLGRLKWMKEVELAKSSREQNLEIICNQNQIFFRTLRTIFKNEILYSYPSKDLEISLALPFVPSIFDPG